MRQGAGRTARQARPPGPWAARPRGNRPAPPRDRPTLRQPDRPDRTGDCQDHRDPLGHRRKCHRGRAVVPPDLSSSPLIPDHRRHGRPAPYRAPGRSHRGAAARPHPRIKAHRPAPGRRRQRHRPARGAAVPDRMTAPRRAPPRGHAIISTLRRPGRGASAGSLPAERHARQGGLAPERLQHRRPAALPKAIRPRHRMDREGRGAGAQGQVQAGGIDQGKVQILGRPRQGELRRNIPPRILRS